MGYRRLFVFVEGIDDARFFEKIMKPELQNKYNSVETRCYASLKKEKINNFLKSIKAMNAEYIFVTDIDNSLCVTAKKQKIKDKLGNIDEERIIVVVKEIEGWYLAGLDNTETKKFKIRTFGRTDSILKEQFNKLFLKAFDSRIDFMIEILKVFSIEIAKQNNESFKYCIEKYTSNVSENINKSV